MVRNIPPQQLFFRLLLMVKRHLAQRMASRFRAWLFAKDLGVSLSENLPQPLFPARTGAFSRVGEGYRFIFLNEERYFERPINWHPRDLEVGTRLWKLNLHYMEFLEECSDEDFQAIVLDWIENNPPYRPHYWMDNWNSYSLSIRCVVWMQQLAVRRARLAPENVTIIQSSIAYQIEFLKRNLELDIGGNHLIKNVKALLWAGEFFDGNHTIEWTAVGERLLASELDSQILADGMHFELSPCYHAQVFADLLECNQVLWDGGLRSKLLGRLERMASVMANLTQPDGFPCLFGDGGLTMSYSPSTILDAWSHLTGQEAQVDETFYFEEAGYAGLRRDNVYVVVDCGRTAPDSLPAHGHGDIFSFELSVGGQRIIVDKGTYEYNPGSKRYASRATHSHNTITLDDQDQSEFFGSFRVGRRARPRDVVCQHTGSGLRICGWHDGYSHLPGAPRHYREFVLSDERILIRDTVKGGEQQEVISRLLVHPKCRVQIDGDVAVLRADFAAVQLTAEGGLFEVTEETWFPNFGEEEPTLLLSLHLGFAPIAETTLIIDVLRSETG